MRRRPGMTLFELVVVMTIIVVLGALASPLIFSALYSDTRVTGGADTVRARWADCRAQAIEEGRPYRFAVIPNSGKFKIEPFQGSLQNTDTAFLNPDDSSRNPGLVIEESLPDGVRFGTRDQPVNTEGP